LIYFYHLGYEDFKEMPFRRVWTLWNNIPGIWDTFWGGKESKEEVKEPNIKELARKFKIKLPRGL